MAVKGVQHGIACHVSRHAVSHNRQIGNGIVVLPLLGKPLQSGKRVIALQQWPAGSRPDTRHQCFGAGLQPDNNAAAVQQRSCFGIAHSATTNRQHNRAGINGITYGAPFHLAEFCFARKFEYLADADPGRLFNNLIAVNECQIKRR